MGDNKLLTIGSRININGFKGTVGAVMWIGERYYMLIDDRGDVSLIPASALEDCHA